MIYTLSNMTEILEYLEKLLGIHYSEWMVVNSQIILIFLAVTF